MLCECVKKKRKKKAETVETCRHPAVTNCNLLPTKLNNPNKCLCFFFMDSCMRVTCPLSLSDFCQFLPIFFSCFFRLGYFFAVLLPITVECTFV
jgi:hypothetical protein